MGKLRHGLPPPPPGSGSQVGAQFGLSVPDDELLSQGTLRLRDSWLSSAQLGQEGARPAPPRGQKRDEKIS